MLGVCSVDVLCIAGTEPEVVLSVNGCMCEWQSALGFQTVCKVHDQVVLVQHLVVFEDESVLTSYPNIVLVVDVQLAQVGEVQDRTVSI